MTSQTTCAFGPSASRIALRQRQDARLALGEDLPHEAVERLDHRAVQGASRLYWSYLPLVK